MICSECNKTNDETNKYCIHCGHKLKTIHEKDKTNNKYCRICGEKLDKEDKYCGICGYEVKEKITKIRICPICGEWMDYERYCENCGHDTLISKNKKGIKNKICPNCGRKHKDYYNYCEECGAKLIKK